MVLQQIADLTLKYAAHLGQKIQVCHLYTHALVIPVDHIVFHAGQSTQPVPGHMAAVQLILQLHLDIAVLPQLTGNQDILI